MLPPGFLSRNSRYIENLMQHRFVFDVSRLLLQCEQPERVAVLQSEVDNSGIDLVMAVRNVTRQIQLKTLARKRNSGRYPIAESLSGMPGACVI